MKKIIISGLLVGLGVSASVVFAQSGVSDIVVPQTPVVTSVSPVVEKEESLNKNSLARLKSRGASLVKERVTTLTSNKLAFEQAKGLTTEQKTGYATLFTTTIAQLETLNTNIQASTDATTTKKLVNSIFTDYRIYAIFVPQVRLEKRINELQNHATTLNTTFTKIQTNIDKAKAEGKDVTVWQKSLDDAKQLVATDTGKLSSLLTQIAALKPSDYGTTSKATITSVNAGVKSVARDFESLRSKVKRPENLKRSPKATQATTTIRGRVMQ